MKTINKTIAIFAIAASMIACTEEEIVPVARPEVPEVPVVPITPENPATPVDTLVVISSFSVANSNGSTNTSNYTVHYNVNGEVSSIDYLATQWSTLKVTNFDWSADHRILSLDHTQTGVGREFHFNADSTLNKIVTITGDGTRITRTFESDGNKIVTMTDAAGDYSTANTVDYNGSDLSGITYYNEGVQYSQITATVGTEVNPIISMKNPEVLAVMYEVEMNEIWIISTKALASTNWDMYQNWDMSYEYNTSGDLSKIVRTENVNMDSPKSSDINFTYKKITL